MSGRRAFTLIEMLVVVAIIALLMSILMPTLKGARDSAQLVTCGTQMHQIGLALSYYITENGSWTPLMANFSGQGHIFRTWPTALTPTYLPKGGTTDALFACPSEQTGWDPWGQRYAKKNFSYAINFDANGIGVGGGHNLVVVSNLERYKNPGAFFFMTELNGPPDPPWYSPWRLSWGTVHGTAWVLRHLPVHNLTRSFKNTMFADMHVEALTLEELCYSRDILGGSATADNWRVHDYNTSMYHHARKRFRSSRSGGGGAWEVY